MSFVIQPYVDGDSITPSTFFKLVQQIQTSTESFEVPVVFASEAGVRAWQPYSKDIELRKVSNRNRVAIALALGVADRILVTMRRASDAEIGFLIVGTSSGYPELTSWLTTRGHTALVAAPSDFKHAYDGKATKFYSFVEVPKAPTYEHSEILTESLKKSWELVAGIKDPDGFVSFTNVITRLKEIMSPSEQEALWQHAAGELGPWVRRLELFEEKLSGTMLRVRLKEAA